MARQAVVDTTSQRERLVGELLNDHLTFQSSVDLEKHKVAPDAVRYYANLRVRHGDYGSGSVDLMAGSVLQLVQLVTPLAIRTAEGIVIQRSAKEIVRITFDT